MVRESLSRDRMEVRDVRASWKGTRDVGGSPCAVFDVVVDARMDVTKEGATLSVDLSVAGEYAIRIEDGRDAELLLTGTMRTAGELHRNYRSIPVNAAGAVRIHGAARYQDSSPLPAGATASR
jgi:hypothetical protein